MGLKCKFMPSKAYLVEEYINKRKTYKEIGFENGVDAAAVCYWIKKYNIPSRQKNKVIHPHIYTEAERAAISKRFRGRKASAETCKKISEARKINGIGAKKKRADGYIAIYYPSYPNCTKDGFVMEHRLVIEKSIGRLLTKNEVVHHINHNRADNRLENLLLMTVSEHCKLHMKERYKK